ncbi:hypothetical protein ABEY41_11765 [Peribacillus butanolivorans]|uniref:hypothetical protein n=1 Tax=Peribacillus butanolivorans TaxID=421767 RepID=UPI003D2DD5B6
MYTELQYQWNQPQQIENDERIIFGGFGSGMGMGTGFGPGMGMGFGPGMGF